MSPQVHRSQHHLADRPLVDLTDQIVRDSAHLIAGGAFGNVYKCRHSDRSGSSSLVAVKALQYFASQDPKEKQRRLRLNKNKGQTLLVDERLHLCTRIACSTETCIVCCLETSHGRKKNNYQVVALKLDAHKPPSCPIDAVVEDGHWALMVICWACPERRPVAHNVVVAVQMFCCRDASIAAHTGGAVGGQLHTQVKLMFCECQIIMWMLDETSGGGPLKHWAFSHRLVGKYQMSDRPPSNLYQTSCVKRPIAILMPAMCFIWVSRSRSAYQSLVEMANFTCSDLNIDFAFGDVYKCRCSDRSGSSFLVAVKALRYFAFEDLEEVLRRLNDPDPISCTIHQGNVLMDEEHNP
ncbi:hypothetical protein V8E55_004174 [Tylopilus felleus]